eukprot:346643-Rhodomonas_salina.2
MREAQEGGGNGSGAGPEGKQAPEGKGWVGGQSTETALLSRSRAAFLPPPASCKAALAIANEMS